MLEIKDIEPFLKVKFTGGDRNDYWRQVFNRYFPAAGLKKEPASYESAFLTLFRLNYGHLPMVVVRAFIAAFENDYDYIKNTKIDHAIRTYPNRDGKRFFDYAEQAWLDAYYLKYKQEAKRMMFAGQRRKAGEMEKMKNMAVDHLEIACDFEVYCRQPLHDKLKAYVYERQLYFPAMMRANRLDLFQTYFIDSDVYSRNKICLTYVTITALSMPNQAFVRKICEKFPDLDSQLNYHYLYVQAKREDLEKFKTYLALQPACALRLITDDRLETSLIAFLIRERLYDFLKVLLAANPELASRTQYGSKTLPHPLTMTTTVEITKLLIEHGADPLAQVGNTLPPLAVAMKEQNITKMRWFIKYKPTIVKPSYNEHSLLYALIAFNDLGIVHDAIQAMKDNHVTLSNRELTYCIANATNIEIAQVIVTMLVAQLDTASATKQYVAENLDLMTTCRDDCLESIWVNCFDDVKLEIHNQPQLIFKALQQKKEYFARKMLHEIMQNPTLFAMRDEQGFNYLARALTNGLLTLASWLYEQGVRLTQNDAEMVKAEIVKSKLVKGVREKVTSLIDNYSGVVKKDETPNASDTKVIEEIIYDKDDWKEFINMAFLNINHLKIEDNGKIISIMIPREWQYTSATLSNNHFSCSVDDEFIMMVIKRVATYLKNRDLASVDKTCAPSIIRIKPKANHIELSEDLRAVIYNLFKNRYLGSAVEFSEENKPKSPKSPMIDPEMVAKRAKKINKILVIDVTSSSIQKTNDYLLLIEQVGSSYTNMSKLPVTSIESTPQAEKITFNCAGLNGLRGNQTETVFYETATVLSAIVTAINKTMDKDIINLVAEEKKYTLIFSKQDIDTNKLLNSGSDIIGNLATIPACNNNATIDKSYTDVIKKIRNLNATQSATVYDRCQALMSMPSPNEVTTTDHDIFYTTYLNHVVHILEIIQCDYLDIRHVSRHLFSKLKWDDYYQLIHPIILLFVEINTDNKMLNLLSDSEYCQRFSKLNDYIKMASGVYTGNYRFRGDAAQLYQLDIRKCLQQLANMDSCDARVDTIDATLAILARMGECFSYRLLLQMIPWQPLVNFCRYVYRETGHNDTERYSKLRKKLYIEFTQLTQNAVEWKALIYKYTQALPTLSNPATLYSPHDAKAAETAEATKALPTPELPALK